MSDNIKNKTIFALKWVTAMQGANTLGQLLVRFVLANLLFPDEIGLIAIVTVITELMVMAADMGFNASVIQRKNLENKHISTAFFVNLAFAAVLMTTVFFSANAISIFFEDFRLEELLKIVSVVILIRASVSVQIGMCDRDLNFKKIVIITLVGLVISSGLKIYLAATGWGPKSIVIGDILNQIIIASYLWITTSWKPSIKQFSLKAFKELFGFGGNIMLVYTLNHLSSKTDLMVIGKLVNTFAAGIFSIAAMVTDMLVSIVNSIVQRVLFPSFSRIQDDESKIQAGYLKATKFISIVGIPICVGIFFLADEIVHIFLQESYEPAIPLIRILAFRAVFNSMGGVLWGQVLKAKGKSGLVLILTIIKLVSLFAFILIGANWGITGIAVATVVYGGIFRFIYQHIINRLIKITMLKYLKALLPSLGNAVLMSAAIFLVKYLLNLGDIGDIYRMGIIILAGAIAYLISFRYIFKNDFLEMKKMIIKK